MPIHIDHITFAVTNIEAMVAFYNTVFDMSLEAIELAPDTIGYYGKLAGILTLLCPNSLARVDAQQNRHQFDFVVEDVEATLALALANGGTALGELQEHQGIRIASVYDPDGNSMVFKQKI